MLEIKVTINTPDLSEALTNLALAIKGDVVQQGAELVIPAGTPMEVVGTAPAPAAEQPTLQPVNPVPAQQTTPPPVNPVNPAPAPVQTATQITPQAPAMNPPVAPQAPKIDLDTISRAGAALADAGKMQQILDLLTNKYRVQAITLLKEDQYQAFADDMKALGAKFE